MVKAILFDFYGVVNLGGEVNAQILEFIRINKTLYCFGILSATKKDLSDWLLAHEIIGYFDYVQTAGKVAKSKLDPLYYTDAISALGLNPSEIIFVDDNNYYAILARGLGMVVINYDPDKDFPSQIMPLL